MILHLPIARGVTLAPWLILIPLWAKGDRAYLAHEQVHAEQQRRIGLFRFWKEYLRNPAFRLTAEIEAYKAQIAAGADIDYCATQLATGYNLDITPMRAKVHLS